MLELKKVTKKYNNIAVVDNVSFKVGAGEILGYLGPNGAGKSTTVKMIAALFEPDQGSIHYREESIHRDLYSYKRKIGYIPEQSEIYTHLTGMEYLELVGGLRLIPKKILKRKIEAVMSEFNLAIDMYLPISSYSKGMTQKVLIASALLHDPEIFILDEPLSGLDVTTALLFKDLLGKLAERGKTIIYSSHILEVIEKLCHRVIIINKGKILANDSVQNLSTLMKLPTLESIFRELVQQKETGRSADNILSAIELR